MANIDPSILKHLSLMQPQLYWLDEDPLEPLPHPTLIGDVTSDLCIVGAGYTGLWTALLAKEANPDREVVVVEQRETGAGASGRNGGFCSYSLTHGFMNGYSRFKDEMAVIEKLGRENLDAIEATILKYGIENQINALKNNTKLDLTKIISIDKESFISNIFSEDLVNNILINNYKEKFLNFVNLYFLKVGINIENNIGLPIASFVDKNELKIISFISE